MIIETVFLGVWQDLGRSEELNNVKAGAESILGRCILLLPQILKYKYLNTNHKYHQ